MRRPAALFLALLLCQSALPCRADEALVSAAASLTDAFREIGAAFERAHPGTRVRFNFAASGPLKQQILRGAPVDVFASASPVEMDELQKRGRVEPVTRADFASNRLVLVVPPGSRVRSWGDLKGAEMKRVALGSPESVPAGRYAKQTLARRGLWRAVASKAVFAENVRQALAYVTGGDADAGLVFATDARKAGKRVRVAATAGPGRDHDPIRYPAAALKDAPNAPAARRIVLFLRGRTAQAALRRHGFLPPQDLRLPPAERLSRPGARPAPANPRHAR